MQLFEIAAMVFGTVLASFVLFAVAITVYCICVNIPRHLKNQPSSRATALTQQTTIQLNQSTKKEETEDKNKRHLQPPTVSLV